MPPKIDVEGILTELKNLNDKVSSLVSVPAKLNKLESLITELSNENKQLRKEIEGRDSTIYQLQNKLNHLEQHHRGWSIRIHNLQLQAGTEVDPRKVMETVHAKLITPILNGALSKGAISTIPMASQILETAHPLPAKSGQARPIIVRFRSRYDRDLMFQFKKEFAPREDTPGGVARGASSDQRLPRLLFPFYEDLTGDTYKKLRELARDDRVAGCWTVGGNIRLKKTSDPSSVLRVKSIYDSNDSILA
jgi:hypothetical protein